LEHARRRARYGVVHSPAKGRRKKEPARSAIYSSTPAPARDGSILQIRAELANAAGGQEACHRVLSEGDVQLQQGLKLFDRAATMLAQRGRRGFRRSSRGRRRRGCRGNLNVPENGKGRR
jgi:hypothetical protein